MILRANRLQFQRPVVGQIFQSAVERATAKAFPDMSGDVGAAAIADADDDSSSISPGTVRDLPAMLGRIRQRALFAKQWCEDRGLGIVDPLTPIVGVLSAHNLVVSDHLGEAGFQVVEGTEIHFNRSVLDGVIRTVREVIGSDSNLTEAALDALCEQAVAMYVFHEITHVAQRFFKHELAQQLKRAFGADELSKLDLVADVRAAHCNTIVSLALQNEFSERAYLEGFRANLLLSYELLTKAFSIRNADHKKKRALGLLTSCVLVQLALNEQGEQHHGLRSLCLRPAFTSVDPAQNCIVALTCGDAGWEILFHAHASTNRMTIPEMWESVGAGDPSDILGLLLVAYEKWLTEPR